MSGEYSEESGAVPGSGDRPAGSAAPPPPIYNHVVWIVMENHAYSQIVGSPSAPYLNRLAAEFGLATNYRAVSHPSLPNYIALTSGSTHGITDDLGPAAHPLHVPNLFAQLEPGGWKALEESMPANCARANAGEYAARHNPAVYYTNLRDCAARNVPLTTSPDLSARFTFITPNLIHDMHDGTVQQGDTWLASFVPTILSSPEYRAGRTALFITWDEDDGSPRNHVATLIVAPSVSPGTRSAAAFDHYSLLRTTEEMLGLAFLANAGRAVGMRGAFGI